MTRRRKQLPPGEVRGIRVAGRTEEILTHMLTNPQTPVWGTLLADKIGMSYGSVYKTLHRLEKFGWVASQPEDPGPWALDINRRLRIYYRLTTLGVWETTRALEGKDTLW